MTQAAPSRPLPQRHVVVHKGDHDAMATAQIIERIARKPLEEAVTAALRVVQNGQATVETCHLERAELLVRSFAREDLHATIEPA